MTRLLLLLGLAPALFGQQYMLAQKSGSLSSAAQVITIQQPASPSYTARLVSAYVGCSVECTVTLERNGTPASSTAFTPVNVNPRFSAPTLEAYHSSNVAVGTVLNTLTIAAGGFQVFDLSGIQLTKNSGKGENFTIRTSSITGNYDIAVKWTEQ